MVIIYEEGTSQSLSHHLPVSNEIHYLYFFDHACLHSGLHVIIPAGPAFN